MARKILAADIGGTHARFGAFESDDQDRLDLVESRWLDTRAFHSFLDLLHELENSGFSLAASSADTTVFAVAGPVIKESFSSPPNIDWDIEISDVVAEFGMRRCVLINDFIAQAYACRSPIIGGARQILSGEADPRAPLAVIGAGTGLGQAALVPLKNGGYTAVASEGAHGGFAFESEKELAYMKYLLQVTGEPYVRAETVVSGAGLVNLHHFITGERLEPAEVAARLGKDSETLRWMARFYGRLCRNVALQMLALGGIYVCGGVATKVSDLVTHTEFARSFHHSSTMRPVLKRIPVYLNTNEESGLWGAAFSAIQTS